MSKTVQLIACALIALVCLGFPAAATPQQSNAPTTISEPEQLQLAQRYYYDPYTGRRYRYRGYNSRSYRPYRPRRAPVRRRRAQPAPAVSLWKVEEGNKDPVQLIVSLPDQKMKVYKGTELVTTSRVSSGRVGYSTPAGVFSILEKKRRHYSNLYGGAPMPHMQRLTWSGVALHASGSVPGYPASHGCIRLPPSFARQLFPFTSIGGHVIVANGDVTPQEFSHVSLPQPLGPEPEPEPVATAPETTQSIGETAATDEPGWFDWITDSATAKTTPETKLAEAQAPQSSPAMNDAKAASEDKSAEPQPAKTALQGEGAPAALYGAGTAQPPEARGETPRDDSKPAANTSSQATATANPKPTSPIRVLITRRTGRERMLEIQKLLFDLGHEPGDIDGYMGRDTANAIKRFQEFEGLTVNGLMSDNLLPHLHKAAGMDEVMEGHLYVRRDHKDVFDAPVLIRNPERPLGTHFFTVMHFEDDATQARWLALSLPDRKARRKPKRPTEAAQSEPTAQVMPSPSEALDRIVIPEKLRVRMNRLLRPGSSLAISDYGLGPETGKGTDFIVLTR